MNTNTVAHDRTIDFALRLTAANLDLEERNRELLVEIAGLRNDLEWCTEVIGAAIDQLHKGHERSLVQKRRYASLLTEHRALRAELGDVPITGRDDPPEATCH